MLSTRFRVGRAIRRLKPRASFLFLCESFNFLKDESHEPRPVAYPRQLRSTSPAVQDGLSGAPNTFSNSLCVDTSSLSCHQAHGIFAFEILPIGYNYLPRV